MTREYLNPNASSLLRRAANFAEIGQSASAMELLEKGLLCLRIASDPARGYILTLDGADAILGFGRYRLAVTSGTLEADDSR